ncbi:hypothetical protein BH10BDE1_BH10BDE1_16820 [soil metagenome]
MKNQTLAFAIVALGLLMISACSNPLGGRSTADQNYQPGTAGNVATPTPAPTPFPSPSVASVSPSGGRNTGGETLTITGADFRPGVIFKIGASACATSTFVSATSGTCVTPVAASIATVSASATNTDAQAATLAGAFTFVGSPKVWLRADAITGLTSGSLVATWNDSSLAANDFTQPVPGSQPSWIANVLNGKPVVRFAGQQMISSSPIGIAGASQRALFFVARKTSTAAKSVFGWGGGSTDAIYDHMNYNGVYMTHFYTHDSFNIGPAFVANVWGLQASVYNGSLFRFALDGVNSSSMAIALVTTDSVAHVGGGAYSTYDGYDGDIAEAIVLPQSVTTTEQTTIQCYLSRKYALNLATCP